MRVTHISDGVAQRSSRYWFHGVDPSEWMPEVGVSDPDTPFTVNFGGFLITGDGHVTLVDTGWGHRAGEIPGMAGAGELPATLARLGVEPGDVDRIVQTHLHADHCGWLVKDDEGTLTFPNATVYVHEREVDYWTSDEVDQIPVNREFATKARPRLRAVTGAGRLHAYDGELPLSDEVTILPTPGHTPGHVSVMVASGGATALLVGDLAHHPVHLEHHCWLPRVDHDPVQSLRSRERITALAADRGATILAPHFPIPTAVDLDRDAAGALRTAVRTDLGSAS
ncbi:MBL fold metallo-hydrolase [Actinomadura litoris]|uniref:MBL fold metallo-hydrolase n=1 Tax=Actinomadura litoris TaxID=2678616 RepID=A0A7K1KSX5_9ACTN|nr:MBL fold metallo-hydrolase [Actinomadura litoris]MUN35290.1 MBL fold metallo-hydrolase [Actinomadura litoris]